MRRTIILSLLFALVAGAVCALRPLKAVDLHLYHAAARSFFLFSGPMYGPNQEFGWPMLYRYPPLFLCLFRPFAPLPLCVAAGIWAALKVLLLGPLVWFWYRRYLPSRFGPALWTSALLLLPYLLYELQVGNVQLFLVETVCLALLLCDKHPFVASLLLGVATSIKVWPGFILPFLAVRGSGRWRVGLQALAATGVLTVAPGFWLGFWVYRCASEGAAHSIFFCSLLIIEPNVQRIAYVALLWPVLYAGIVMTDQKAPQSMRWVLMGAATVAVLEPLVPGAASQRLAQVLGIDFFGVLVPLTIAHLVYSSWGMSSPLWKPSPNDSEALH
jgi:hypothetical protein